VLCVCCSRGWIEGMGWASSTGFDNRKENEFQTIS
jgi:hypothetical protein